MKEKEPTYSLRDLLTIVFKHKYKIIFSIIPIVIVTILLSLAVPANYVAKAAIMIKPGREFIPSTDVGISENRLPVVNFESAINTEIQILTSNDLVSKVINVVGVFNLYPDLKSRKQSAEKIAVDRFLQDLLVKPVKSSNVIEIYFRHLNPQMAAKVANTLSEQLKDKHLQVFGETKSPFIEEQLKNYEAKLMEASSKLSAFKDKNQITNLKDQYYFIIGKRTEIESMLKIEDSRYYELIKRIEFLKGQKKKAVSDLYTATVGAKLVDLEAKETQLLATYKEDSRPVINIRKQIQKVKDALRQYEEEQKESKEFSSLEADIGPLKLKIANLQQQMVRLDKQLASLSTDGEELNKLERNVSIAQTNFEIYSKKHEEARISEDMDRRKITNIQVIEQAVVPTSSIKTNQRKILGVGFFMALVVGFGLAYLFEIIPQGMTTPEAVVKHLRLPVLITVSYKMPRR
jgi:uncharacterized protein involved in exopolysaccharide biosynthesis